MLQPTASLGFISVSFLEEDTALFRGVTALLLHPKYRFSLSAGVCLGLFGFGSVCINSRKQNQSFFCPFQSVLLLFRAANPREQQRCCPGSGSSRAAFPPPATLVLHFHFPPGNPNNGLHFHFPPGNPNNGIFAGERAGQV